MTHLPRWCTAVWRILWHSGHLHNHFPWCICVRGAAVLLYRTVPCMFGREWDLLKASEWKTVVPALGCPIATVPGTVGRCIPTSFDFSDVDNPFPEKSEWDWFNGSKLVWLSHILLLEIHWSPASVSLQQNTLPMCALRRSEKRHEYSYVRKSDTLSKGFIFGGHKRALDPPHKGQSCICESAFTAHKYVRWQQCLVFSVLWRCLVLSSRLRMANVKWSNCLSQKRTTLMLTLSPSHTLLFKVLA